MVKIKCIVCSSEFAEKSSVNKYCSVKCRRKFYNIKYADKSKEYYKAYYNLTSYGGNRGKVLIRDDNKCQKCFTTKGLCIHHKDGSGQSELPNNDTDNLITLCKACHRKEHTSGGIVQTICLYCKKKYSTNRHDVVNDNRKYCSKECCDKDKVGKTRTGYFTNCLICDEEFKTTPYKVSIGKGKYCSRQCSSKSQSKRISVNCMQCNLEFETIPAKIKHGRGKFCSAHCSGKYYRNKQLERV